MVSIDFFRTHNKNIFFYHALGAPLHFHAVYFSVWILLAIAFLLLEILSGLYVRFRLWFMLLLLSWFSIFLLLLSSKLIIIIFVIILPFILILNFSKFLKQPYLIVVSLLMVIICIAVLFSHNPISERFMDIQKPGISMLDNEKHESNRSEYFNGLNLRVLFWKFGYEIMNERQAWVFGVSGGDSQRLLNEKITNAHMYTGSPGNTDKGYLGYNFHNQFVESWVQSGLLGVTLLILIFVSLFATAIKKRELLFGLFVFVFFSFFFSESALERQIGVVPFAIFSMVFASWRLPSAPSNPSLSKT